MRGLLRKCDVSLLYLAISWYAPSRTKLCANFFSCDNVAIRFFFSFTYSENNITKISIFVCITSFYFAHYNRRVGERMTNLVREFRYKRQRRDLSQIVTSVQSGQVRT